MQSDWERVNNPTLAWFLFCHAPSVDDSWLAQIQSQGMSTVDKALAAKKWLSGFTPACQNAPNRWITEGGHELVELFEFVGFCACAASSELMRSAPMARALVSAVGHGTYARFQAAPELIRGRQCAFPEIVSSSGVEPLKIGVGMAIAVGSRWGDGVAERIRLRLPRSVLEREITGTDSQLIQWNDWIEGIHNEFCND